MPGGCAGRSCGGFTGKNKIVSRIDKRDVRESLRKIAGEAFRSRVVFLGQKPDIVAQAGQSFEKPARVGDAAEHQKAIGKPEAAGQKRAFPRRQPIVRFFGVVAQNEALGREAALDGFHRAAHTRIRYRQETNQGHEQNASVERVGAVVTGRRLRVPR